jgi:hypothetical protein
MDRPRSSRRQEALNSKLESVRAFSRRLPRLGRGRHRPQVRDVESVRTAPSALQALLASCYAEFPGLPEKIDSLEHALELNGEFWDLLAGYPMPVH